MIIAVAAYDSVAAHLSRIAYQADVGVGIEHVAHHHDLAVVINRYDVLLARDDFVRLHKAFARKVRCRSRYYRRRRYRRFVGIYSYIINIAAVTSFACIRILYI